MEKDDLLLTKAMALAMQLNLFYETLRIDDSRITPEIRQVLTVPLCQMAKAIVPNIQSKVDEHVFAAQHGFSVNDRIHGADLLDGQKEPI